MKKVVAGLFAVLLCLSACSSSKETFYPIEKCGRTFFQSDKHIYGVVNNQIQPLFDGTYSFKSTSCQFTVKNSKLVN